MATKIVTKNSSTASAVPTTSDLVQGELAVNVADKRLFTEDNGGSIVELGTNPSTIDINAGSIDGTAIGASSASTGAFTTLTATGLTVDTTTLAVDSTNNRVGIGTASPSQALTVDGTDARIYLTGANTDIDMDGSANGQLHLDGNAYGFGIALNASGANLYTNSVSRDLIFGVNETEVMRVTNSNVGIGTSAPEYNLDVTAADNVTTTTAISVQNSSRNYGLGLGAYTLTNRNIGGSATTVDYTFDIGRHAIFKTNNAERMRIDSSGNLLVGTTTSIPAGSSQNVVGVAIQGGDGEIQASSEAVALYANRKDTDGDIAVFRKNGADVGSIGVKDSDIYIGKAAVGLSFDVTGADGIRPFSVSGQAYRDNAIDLGGASARFDDIYATNPTINTSDRNEKQDIAELSDAEQRVAVACKGLLRKFRWKDSVAEKGDDARIHFGIIAQDLQAAFEAQGLDAGDYAMFISTTWWEQDVEVPAVEAVEAVYETQTDEEGNETQVLISEAIESVDAYTETHNYSTIEEAPEGATEKTRLGVRYSELLAFIIAAL